MRHFSIFERIKQPNIIRAKDLIHMVSDNDLVAPEYSYLKILEKIDIIVRTAQYFDERQVEYDYSDDDFGENTSTALTQTKLILLQRGYHISYKPDIPVLKISW